MKIPLLYRVSHYQGTKTNVKTWDQQNYRVISGFSLSGYQNKEM